MSERRLADTNLIVRFLMRDHEKHAQAARRLMAACDQGEITLILLPIVLAECVFVLASFYQQSRDHVARALGDFISSPGIELSGTSLYLDALDRYRTSNIHFVDCVIAATAARDDIAIATFDRDFRKFSDVRVNID
jgi:predicted nucleic acid-binding protein